MLINNYLAVAMLVDITNGSLMPCLAQISLSVMEKIPYFQPFYHDYKFMGSFSCNGKQSGPSCSKLTMSLVNDSLKFTSSDTQIR